MPLNPSVAHLEFVLGAGLVLREPGRSQTIPMTYDAVEQMCADLDARGEHIEAARHRQALKVLHAIATQTTGHQDHIGRKGS